MKKNNARIAFFGTEPLAKASLDALEAAGYAPSLIVASPDKLARDKSTIFPVEKEWAIARAIPTIQPEKITQDLIDELALEAWDLFIVASYGKFLPKALLDIPKHGSLNVHPSLLPRLRGPSPIRSAILNDEKKTGVSIIKLDEEMDHGPLVAQKEIPITSWPPRGSELDLALARAGGELLARILPAWLKDEIEAREQNHDLATFCEHIKKEDGLLDLKEAAYTHLLKVRAFEGWPGTYAFFERNGKKIRVQIVSAHLDGATLVIDRVKPEGKSEMNYADFLRSGAQSV